MHFHVTGCIKGETRTLNIHFTGSDADTLALIDSLDQAGGPAEMMAAAITATVGMVSLDTSPQADVARMLRYYADVLDRNKGNCVTSDGKIVKP
jgi:hypothetical protein